jgi:hypothetical protein
MSWPSCFNPERESVSRCTTYRTPGHPQDRCRWGDENLAPTAIPWSSDCPALSKVVTMTTTCKLSGWFKWLHCSWEPAAVQPMKCTYWHQAQVIFTTAQRGCSIYSKSSMSRGTHTVIHKSSLLHGTHIVLHKSSPSQGTQRVIYKSSPLCRTQEALHKSSPLHGTQSDPQIQPITLNTNGDPLIITWNTKSNPQIQSIMWNTNSDPQIQPVTWNTNSDPHIQPITWNTNSDPHIQPVTWNTDSDPQIQPITWNTKWSTNPVCYAENNESSNHFSGQLQWRTNTFFIPTGAIHR